MASAVTREEIQHAAACQEGEECSAIDGDARGVYPIDFFTGKVPPTWLLRIREDLLRTHEGILDADGSSLTAIEGVDMLSFYKWLAVRIFEIDASFQHDGHKYRGIGRKAQAMRRAIASWAFS